MIVMRAKPDASKHNFMYVTGVDSGGRGGLGSFARHPLFGEAEKKNRKDENDCEHYGRNKGKHFRQVSCCNYKNFLLARVVVAFLV